MCLTNCSASSAPTRGQTGYSRAARGQDILVRLRPSRRRRGQRIVHAPIDHPRGAEPAVLGRGSTGGGAGAGSIAGSLGRGLDLLRVPPILLDAWSCSASTAMDTSAAWLASQRPDALGRVALTPSVRALRGDTYGDLAEAVGSVAVAGDGALDPARLRRQYTIDRAAWLRMVADLLGQVVGDAGSVERASTVLAVLDSLLAWVRWFVSRGSIEAACSRWPVASGDAPDLTAYDDLAEAVERGAVDGDNAIGPPSVRDVYAVRFDSWERLAADLLGQIIADAGSVSAAAKVLDVPRATLGAWVQRR